MYKSAISLILGAAYLLLVVGSQADEVEVEETQFACERLPSNVVPTEYQLKLKFLDFDSRLYTGRVDISLEFLRDDDARYKELVRGVDASRTCKLSSNTIVLHAGADLEIEDIEVSTESCRSGCFGGGSGGGRQKGRQIRSVKHDLEKELLAIRLWKGINAGGSGKLSIRFQGRFRNDKRGVYTSIYKDGIRDHEHIVTQFQPTDARKAFPVFDEPRFKAPFKLSIAHRTLYVALSNMEIEAEKEGKSYRGIHSEMMTTTFKRSPPMSAHMLAFTVGDFAEPLEFQAKSKVGATESSYTVRVFTAPGQRELGRFALEVAQRSLEHFEDYIQYGFPLTKFDLVAIADRNLDNTESWGLAFIRDSLVWVDNETQPNSLITTAVNVAHVCVHQWFANLVTVAWWNDLWITEGVAASFAFKIVRELYPKFESEYFVRLATLSRVLQKDAPGNWHVLRPELDDLRTSEHIYAIFDDVGFMKSAALASMVDKWMATERPDWYRRFLQSLVHTFAHKSITREDYILVMRNTVRPYVGADEAAIVPDMIKLIDSLGSTHGVPLVNAKLEGDRLLIDLELMHSARKDIVAPAVKQSQSIMVFDDVRLHFVDANQDESWWKLAPRKRAFSSDHALSMVGAGDIKWAKVSSQPDINTYFRVRYSPSAYQALCEPISARTMSAMDRLHVLDDANVLAQAHLISGDSFKQLVDCFGDEDNGAVLIELMVALKTLSSLQLSSPSSKAILSIFEKHGFAVTGEETFLEQRSRSIGLKVLITQGNQQVIEAALKTFDEGQVALFLRDPVYTAVVLAGTKAQVSKLIAKMKATKSYDEKLILAGALSLSADKGVLDKLSVWLKFDSNLKEAIIEPFKQVIAPKLWPKSSKN